MPSGVRRKNADSSSAAGRMPHHHNDVFGLSLGKFPHLGDPASGLKLEEAISRRKRFHKLNTGILNRYATARI